MNRIYRLVWSDRHHAFEPAAETARRRGKRSGGGKSLVGGLVAGALSTSAFASGGAVAPTALPTAPTVTVGQATVASKGSQMTVTEATATAAINWGSFNIGSAAGVTFVQPSSKSVVLNRVLSGDPSQIYGTLKANGIVFLINPQGVLVGKGAEVNVGGLVASTLSLSDKDLQAGNWAFSGSDGTGEVSNAGAIHVAPGGFAALVGAKVENTGLIAAKLGSVALASGRQVTLDFDDAGLLKVAVKQGALDAMVDNAGAIVADGGRIVMTAKSANDVLGTVVNNTGVLQSQSLGMRDGQIWLLAADPVANTGANGAGANGGAVQGAAGSVASSGQIDVSGNGQHAGEVTLAGTAVDLGGRIDAGAAHAAAGHVLINSTESSTLESDSVIDVRSGAAGGKVVVWSDGSTQAHGGIDGRGTGAAGTGATVEVSAGHDLSFDARVNLAADVAAKAGTLILDPATLEIAAGAGTASPNVVYQSALQTQSGNIVLSATGQITVDALANNVLNLANASGFSLTSETSGGISFLNGAGGAPSGITTHGAPVTLTASGSGSIDNVGTIATNGGSIALSGVYVHLAGGLNATNGVNPAGDVAVSIFGGGLLSSSPGAIAGGHVLLDATYGYIGTSAAALRTSTANLTVKTGGNAYVTNSGSLGTLALTSNHLEGTPVGIGITAANLTLTGADGGGTGTLYSKAVRWTQFGAANPSGSLAGLTSMTLTEDGNLLPGTLNLPQTALSLVSSQGYILGGNTQPVTAASLALASPLGIGGTDFNGINAETDQSNPGAAGGNTLLTKAGSITANVIDPSGNITGIANLTQQGNLLGSVQAGDVLLQATGNIGSAGQHFALNTGWYGDAFNVSAGGNIYLNSGFSNAVEFGNVQAGGILALQATDALSGDGGGGATIGQATAGGALTLTGVLNSTLTVHAASSTSGSISLGNDYNLEVDAATLNGTGAAGRSIALTSNQGTVIFGALSTNGPAGAAAAAAPLGNISISAPQGGIYDLSYWNGSQQLGVLRAGNASLSALYGIYINHTAVDTHANLSMTNSGPGLYGGGQIYAGILGVDSVTDPTGAAAHSVHLAALNNYYGSIYVNDTNGDLKIGSVRAYDDYGGGSSSSESIYLLTNGSILADGSLGGGRINAADLDGNGGYVDLSAQHGLGQRGTGADGTTGAAYLSLSANYLDIQTGGDLFVKNDQGYVSLNLSLNYASGASPYFYHFTSASAAEAQANTPAVTFHAASSAGLLTVNSGSIDDSGSYVSLSGDGNIQVKSFQGGQYSSLQITGENLSVDAPADNTPALSMGGYSSLYMNANGSLTVGNMASLGGSPGSNYVSLQANGGNLTLGKVSAANANVNVNAAGGDILGSAGNQVLATNLQLSNSFGAIGADPLAGGSTPIKIGVSADLTINNQGGGGSINLLTLNDPASLNLTLSTPNSPGYAGAHFRIAPSATGLGLSGSAAAGAVTLSTLGTTGGNAAAVPVTITADTPSISIASGAGPQLGIGYDLYFGYSNQSETINLSGSAGQNVIVHADNSSLNSLTGTIALTHLQLDTAIYSYYDPLSVDLSLAQPLHAFTLLRGGSDGDPAAFNGNTVTLSGSGQSFTAMETAGTATSPGIMTVNAASAAALDLTVQLQTAGLIDVGSINFAGLGAVNLSTYVGSVPFGGISSAIENVDGSSSINAGSVSLSATGAYAGQATLGTSAAPLNVTAANVALTSSGDIYVNTAGTLASLAVAAFHPAQDTSYNYTGYSANYVYQIGGSTSLSATDDAADTLTSIGSFTSSTPVGFSFTSDRSILVGSIDAGAAGSVTLTANGNWMSWPYYNSTHIGIEQGSGSGITAGSVNLNANGYRGHAGTAATALDVDAAHLSINVNGDINVADAAALDSLSLTVAHGYDNALNYTPNNSYAITAPNIALSLVDNWNGDFYQNVQLQNLVSATLQTFTINVADTSLKLGDANGNFSTGQISLSDTATVNLASTQSIWQQVAGGYSVLDDAASGAVPDSAVAIKAGNLNFSAGSDVMYSPNSGQGLGAHTSIPVEVTNLSVSAGGSAAVTNVGNLNLVSAGIGGSGYFRAVEAAPATAASISGGSANAPIAAPNLTLVAFYGDIGSAGTPVVTNASTLSLQSGADIYAANQSSLSSLSINSDHNKSSIGDVSNNGLNTLSVTDASSQGGVPLQLGVTDLGAGSGGYQLTGLNKPLLDFSFETDTSISVGALTANSVALISDNGSILHIASAGAITAGAVSLTAFNPGQSVGASGQNILTNTPNLSVWTGGNLYVADSATLDSLTFRVLGVTTLAGGATPAYVLDNAAAAHPLVFNVTGDTANNVLDVNSIVVSRTDAPVSLSVSAVGSSVGVNRITDNAAAGGSVSVSSQSNSVFGLGGSPAGIAAGTVSLSSGSGNVGDDAGGTAAPVVVLADSVNVDSYGDIRITSPGSIANLSLQQGVNYNPSASSVWSVATPNFNFAGGYDAVAGTLGLTSATGTSTNLGVGAYPNLLVGTVNLGSGSLALNSYYGSIDSDGTNGGNANLRTTGDVTLNANTGIGGAAQVTTDVGGNVNLGTQFGGVNLAQISATPLLIGNLSANSCCGNNPFTITAAGNMTLLNGLSTGGGVGSAVTLTAGGDINYANTTLNLSNAPITLSAGGSIIGGYIYYASAVSLTAAGTAPGSAGEISVSDIDANWWAAAAPITLLAKGDVNLSGTVVSTAGVSVTSTAGSIYGQSYGTFNITPTVTLSAAGDIGGGSAGSVTPWFVNGNYTGNPASLTLSAQAGGQINLGAYSIVNATQLAAGGDVSLQLLGDNWHIVNTSLNFGQVSSTHGSVSLSTAQGDIRAIDGSSAIDAATSITLAAQQNPYFIDSGTPVNQAFNLGTSGSPLKLSAPQINLTANGNIYATVPVAGLAGLSVARTYVPYVANYPNNQAVLMPAGTILIRDAGANTVLAVADGGWAQGGISALDAAYGTALDLSYSANNAIQLGTVNLNGGDLALQAANPFDISITSSGGLIQANAFSFNLIDSNGIDGRQGTASGGFGTLADPIHTRIGSLSGTTVGDTAGVFIDQDGSIEFTDLSTGGDISVTTTRLSGAPGANANILVGHVSSNGSISLNADGTIGAAGGVASPTISASGPSNDGGVTLTAAAGILLPSASIASGNGNVALHALAGGIGLAAGAVQTSGSGSQISLTADSGDIVFGSIQSAGTVALTATAGAINGTTAAQNLTGLPNGITAGAAISLNAATGIGSSAVAVSADTSGSGGTITANTANGDINLVLGGVNPSNSVVFEADGGGAINLANYYAELELDGVRSQDDIRVTQQNFYGHVALNNVAAAGPGATLVVAVPYGDISSFDANGVVSASRIVLNALGDASGGTLGMSSSPVNVDAQVVIAVASGDIALNSVATGVTKMPLVASNGDAPTISITSAGDFDVGQIVAGHQGTVDIRSAAGIYDDGDATTRIYAGTVDLTAAGAIGTVQTPIQTSAVAFDGTGAAVPGAISAASTTLGDIYLSQQGDAVLQSLTAANGSINVTINDQALGQSSLVFADTTAADLAGNDVNITVTNGDLTVSRAMAGMSAGTVNLRALAGSLYGDGRADCCTIPNVSGDDVILSAHTNIGSISDMPTLAGVAVGVQANHSTATTSAIGSQIYLQYVGDAMVGSAAPNSVSALGSNAQILLAACDTLTLLGMDLGTASVGLNAGTGGSGGSVVDGITGGASAAHPDVTAASVTVGAATNVGGANAALVFNAAALSAAASGGGVWINDSASTPVTVTSASAAGGPVVIGSRGNLLVGSVNAGAGSVTLNSAAGAVLEGRSGGSGAAHPNVIAASVTVHSATGAGSAGDALWVDSAMLTASAASGGVWINDAATTPVTLASVTTGGGPVVIGSQGNLLVASVNAGSGSATLNSVQGSVLDGVAGGSTAAHPNVIAGAVTVNAGANAGSAADALWVNAAAINGSAAAGGLWINDAAIAPVTLGSVTTGGGPVVIGSQGNLLVDSVNAGGGSVTLNSSGAVLDGAPGGSGAANPNVTAGSLSVNAATNAGSATHALWVDAASLTASAAGGGLWINDAATTPVTLASISTGGGPVVIGSQGNLLVASVNAGGGSATLNSVQGSVLDGISGGSSAAHPNVMAGSVTVNASVNAGSAADALWVNAAVISGSAASGGVWINDAATTPVTVASVTTGGGPVVIGGQGNLRVESVNAGGGSATLNSAQGSVLDGIAGGSSAAHPNVTSGSVTVNAAVNVGSPTDALWVDSAVIRGSAAGGGVWINDAATTPVTLASISTGGGPAVIGSQGNLLVDSVNVGSGGATLNSTHGSVLDGIAGGSSAAHPNVTAGAVTINAASNAGSATRALWVDAASVGGSAAGGGLWINDAAATPVTLASISTGGGPVVIGGRGNLLVGTVNAGSGSVTLNSAGGAVLDGMAGGSSAAHPNVTSGSVTVNASSDVGNAGDPLWVDSSRITASAASGGVWINDAATTPVTLASITTSGGPVAIGSQGDLLVQSVDAGRGDVTLASLTGSILDGISGGASVAHPNITGGIVTLTAARTVGLISDRIYISADSYTATAPGGIYINTPPTPYPDIPLVSGISPVTVFSALAHAQILPHQQLPITLIGQPIRMAPPIEVTAELLGIALPQGADSSAAQQDATMDTAPKPIFGGNEDEIGRKQVNMKVRKKAVKQSKLKAAPQTTWQG